MKIRAIDMLRLFLLFTYSSAVLVSQNYEAIPAFENKMSMLVPINNKNADSLVRCAMFCSFGCKTFNYNHNAGMCLTYDTCHTWNMSVTAMGWQLYNSLSYRLGEEECKRSSFGYNYTGHISVTQSGRTCQAWNSQTPHKHKHTSLQENYCRNPDGEPAPWCYTIDPDKRWEICNIPYCGLVEEECKRSRSGFEYTGKVSVTKSGRTCQAWNSQTPHSHNLTSLPENYCRNPDDDKPAPWCYTTDPDKRWEICNIPYCVTCPLECLQKNDPKGKIYFGTISVTRTGDPCQRWDSQTPHTHGFGYRLADHENYCRNPDEDDGPWCYTTKSDKRYDYCTVPHC